MTLSAPENKGRSATMRIRARRPRWTLLQTQFAPWCAMARSIRPFTQTRMSSALKWTACFTLVGFSLGTRVKSPSRVTTSRDDSARRLSSVCGARRAPSTSSSTAVLTGGHKFVWVRVATRRVWFAPITVGLSICVGRSVGYRPKIELKSRWLRSPDPVPDRSWRTSHEILAGQK